MSGQFAGIKSVLGKVGTIGLVVCGGVFFGEVGKGDGGIDLGHFLLIIGIVGIQLRGFLVFEEGAIGIRLGLGSSLFVAGGGEIHPAGEVPEAGE